MSSWISRCASALVFLAALAAPAGVGAAPVATDLSELRIASGEARLSASGSALLPVTDGVVVVSTADLGLQALTLFSAGDQGAIGERVVTGPAASQGRRIVAVDGAGPDLVASGLADDVLTPVVRLFEADVETPDGLTELSAAVLPPAVAGDVRRFGTDVALGGNAVAVVSETTGQVDRVDVFTVSAEGALVWAQELLPETLNSSIAISASGATIAVSGVNRFAAAGDVVVHRIGSGGWIPTQRFLRIGGGPIVMDGERIWVQRNSFFVRPAGPWSLIEAAPGRSYAVVEELPVEGDALAANGPTVAVGDSGNDRFYLLSAGPGAARKYRFSQAVPALSDRPGREPPALGTAMAFVGDALYVGAPGPTAEAPGGQVYRFDVVDGPVGCTITGTSGDDELVAADDDSGRRHTICGLAGSDVLIGSTSADRLFGGDGADRLTAGSGGGVLDGGPGLDRCESPTPAVIFADCEEP